MPELFTVPEAAKRVRRSERMIRRWIARGMATVRTRDADGRVRVRIALPDLQAQLRLSIRENPTRRREE